MPLFYFKKIPTKEPEITKDDHMMNKVMKVGQTKLKLQEKEHKAAKSVHCTRKCCLTGQQHWIQSKVIGKILMCMIIHVTPLVPQGYPNRKKRGHPV